ncbi:MAG: DNA mismatch repair endonuclease MutL [Thermoplasmata archaeon]
MGRIRLLDQETVSLIAAGEVIEKPANIVKELVENSIDAESSSIKISLKSGGKDTIIVDDNGIGMSYEDAILSIKRHATSKIYYKEDLRNIRTFGFRGEALHSITSISESLIETGEGYDSSGTRLKIRYGEVVDVEKISPRKGTYIRVWNIFGNLPARRSTLRSDSIELREIVDLFLQYAIFYFNIKFKLENDGTILYDLPQTNNRIERISYIYGSEISKDLVEKSFDYGNLKINLVASKTYFEKRPNKIFVYVNSRPINQSPFIQTIISGYGSHIFHGQYPLILLDIEIDPNLVDVNVHPSKTRVRFLNEYEVLKVIKNSIEKIFEDEVSIPEASIKEKNIELENIRFSSQKTFEVEPKIVQKKIEENIGEIKGISIVGQALNTYIICDIGDGILIIDQHAAHERIRAENILEYMKMEKKQNLINPIDLEMNPADIKILKEYKEIFEEIGFDYDIYETMLVLRNIPDIFLKSNIRDVLREGIERIREMNMRNISEEEKYKIASLMACRGAIMAGDKLSYEEMKNLVHSLMKCKNPFNCPHGRPTMIKIGKEELEKMFKRKI